jgi:hypothetical protein
MSDFNKDMATWYPLLPIDNVLPDQNITGIRGLSINIIVPCTMSILPVDAKLDNGHIVAQLIDLDKVRLSYFSHTPIEEQLVRHIGVDSNPTGSFTSNSSFIIFDKDCNLNALRSFITQYTPFIHPDCYNIYAAAPYLGIAGYGRMYSTGHSESTNYFGINAPESTHPLPGDSDEDAAENPRISVVIPTGIIDGYNCAASTAGSTISFSGGANLGKGIVDIAGDAYADAEDLYTDDTGRLINPAGSGLRSINGITDVQIKGQGSAIVSTSESAVASAKTITISISGRPHTVEDQTT